MATAYEMLDTHPDYVEGVASLADWGQNQDSPTTFSLFLDLIGYSGEVYGQAMFFPSVGAYGAEPATAERMQELYERTLGYVELGYLADALSEYANRPQDVRAWLDQFMATEED